MFDVFGLRSRCSRCGRTELVYIGAVQYAGQVWFDFSERSVWEFYRFVRELAERGDTVSLDWLPLPPPGQEAISSSFLSLDEPDDRGRFLHAALGLVHLEGADPTHHTTIAAAAAAAGGLSVDDTVNRAALDGLRSEAVSLGVREVPTIYRHGPVVHVQLNGAATLGDVRARAATIWAMLDDDGIWGLEKP